MNDVFKALADSTRRQILLMLAKKPVTVNEIAERFDMSRPAISRHIKVLRQSNLITTRHSQSDTRQIFCYAQIEALKEVEEYMQKLETFWQSRLDNLGKYLDKQKIENK